MVHQKKSFCWLIFQCATMLAISFCTYTETQIPPSTEDTLPLTPTATFIPPAGTIIPTIVPTESTSIEEHIWILPTVNFETPVPKLEMEITGPCSRVGPDAKKFPDPDQLQWTRQQENLSELTGFTTEVHAFEEAPDGSWALFELMAPRELVHELFEQTALYLTNMNGSNAWLVSKSGYMYANRYVWLSEGRFLWVDQEMVFIAGLDGDSREDLHAPEAIRQVWRGAESIILAQGKSSMWLLDASSGIWEKMDVPSLSVTTVAHDGSYALSQGPAQAEGMDFGLYYFDLDVDAQPRLLVESKRVGGHGGPAKRPQQLGTGQIWTSGEWLKFEGLALGDLGIIDVEQGNVTHINKLMGFDESTYTITSFSPDGHWINVREIDTNLHAIIDIDAPGTNWFVEGRFLTWLEGEDAILVFRIEEVESGNQTTKKASILRMNLRDGSTSVFLTDIKEGTPEILVSGDRIFVIEDRSNINAYSLEGNLLDTLSFPPGVVPAIEAFGERGLSLSFEATAKNDQSEELCQKRTLWIWQP